MAVCSTRNALQADYLRLLAAYNTRLAKLGQESGFASAEARSTGLLEECISARNAFHKHAYAHKCGEPKASATAA